MPTTTTQFDTENIYNWDSITETYEGALLLSRYTKYDNQTEREEYYQDGLPITIIQTDNPVPSALDGSILSFDLTFSFFDLNGNIERSFTETADGVQTEELFVGGVRSSTVEIDSPGVLGPNGSRVWDRIETTYDTAGNVSFRNTVFDTGVERQESYVNGQRVSMLQLDNPGSGDDGVNSWVQIETLYNAQNVTERRVIEFDDGVIRDDFYENGQRVRSLQLDNPDSNDDGARNWSRQENFYDSEGTLERRLMNFDNGIEREDFYTNGQRASAVLLDNPDSGDGGTQNWSRQENTYDINGDLALRVTDYDNGRIREETYEAGQRASVYWQDNPTSNDGGVYSWAATFRSFDTNGDVETDVMIFDNGDGEAEYFEDGELTQLLEYDGNESDPWLGRRTTYDDAGDVALVELWQTELELPAEFDFVDTPNI